MVVILTRSNAILAATSPSLGAAVTYGLLATTYTNSTVTTINGDVGFAVAPTTPPVGTHTNYGSSGNYAAAGAGQDSAASSLSTQGCTFTWGAAVDLSADASHGTVGVYTPGVYCSDGAMNMTSSITLSGNGTYIFRATGALNTTAGAVVNLSGASACDVFWTPSGATTLGAGTNFSGTIIDDAAVTIGTGTTLTGRVLAFHGPVTTATTTINLPTCTGILHVIKDVTNDSGGSTTAAGFQMHVKLAGTDVSGSPAAGVATSGTSYTLTPGTYVVSEDANLSYVRSFSGDCDTNGNITLAYGDNKTCTVTNDDILPVPAPASITVIKTVINDSGRTKTVDNFPLFVNGASVVSGATNAFPAGSYAITETTNPNYTQTFSGDCDSGGHLTLKPGNNLVCLVINDDVTETIVVVPSVPPLIDVVKVPSPLSLPSGSGLVTYTYTLRNTGTVTVKNVTMVGDSCSPIKLISGDTNANAKLEVSETWVYRCAMTLNATHTNTVVTTGLANGLTATDIASATVVVGAPVVPPLIHVTKVPSLLTLLTAGGMITYTEKVTNPGEVPVSNVQLVDDTCSPMKYISGDANKDTLLDMTETWIYMCRTSVKKTTLNTAIVSGEANGLTARDPAIATVVVAASLPTLPNTGFAPEQIVTPWIKIIFGLVIILAAGTYISQLLPKPKKP